MPLLPPRSVYPPKMALGMLPLKSEAPTERAAGPALLRIPPPLKATPAELLSILQPMTAAVPTFWIKMPPPGPVEELPDRVLSLKVSVPKF